MGLCWSKLAYWVDKYIINPVKEKAERNAEESRLRSLKRLKGAIVNSDKEPRPPIPKPLEATKSTSGINPRCPPVLKPLEAKPTPDPKPPLPPIDLDSQLLSKALDLALQTRLSPFSTGFIHTTWRSSLRAPRSAVVVNEGTTRITSPGNTIPIATVTEDRATEYLAHRKKVLRKRRYLATTLPAIAAMSSSPPSCSARPAGPGQRLGRLPTMLERAAIWKRLQNNLTRPIIGRIVANKYTHTDDHVAYVRRCRALFAELRALKEVEEWMELDLLMESLQQAMFKPFVRYIARDRYVLSLDDAYAKFIVHEDVRKYYVPLWLSGTMPELLCD
ncbi:uncharacterized protein LDX57_009425 [Aspergillus melleus]|uniref:uncharacterized protein n=1 Tax=Aspergillus melleus TaxID=138277 RepID=UPI001E8D4E26|nr:uncharacterized protein LDX57_009425 [Aspergillus melleus]KAH8431772.1 hypothetical protein LDX57_009425 [Aspergillus melleus]